MASIRRAQTRDAETIARLSAEAAAEEGVASALDSDRVRMHAFGQNPLIDIWLAEVRGAKPYGLAVIAKSYDIRRALPQVTLCELYVAPAGRRGGAARQLMSAAAQRAVDLGARELHITTGVENAVAQRFFAAIGARQRNAAMFVLSADGIEWLAAEAN